MTRARLLAETDAMELARWRAKERIDGPVGKREQEVRVARALMHVIAHLVPGLDAALVNYLPPWMQLQPDIATPPEAQDEEEMKAVWNAAAASWG